MTIVFLYVFIGLTVICFVSMIVCMVLLQQERSISQALLHKCDELKSQNISLTYQNSRLQKEIEIYEDQD